jgi:arginine decarboxylase-like protein
MVIIEKLKYLNLEISTGKFINTKENIKIRCRLNSTEDHSWHSSNSQLNLIIDLIQKNYINWGKRQDDLELKFENL